MWAGRLADSSFFFLHCLMHATSTHTQDTPHQHRADKHHEQQQRSLAWRIPASWNGPR